MGLSYEQIGSSYGVSASAPNERFRRMDIVPARSENKINQIDAKKLVHLYAIDKLSLALIAEAFNVSVSTVKKALKFYRLPKRRRPSHGGKHFDRLRKLEIGEAVVIECPAKYPQTVLKSSARRLGIKIFIEPFADHLFHVTRVDPAENRITFQLAQMDRRQLEELYAAGKLTIKEIAAEMNVPVRKIKQALRAFGMPKRTRNRNYGKYTSVLGVMKIGDSAELECATKRPHINLHTIANRVGIKISIRRTSEGRYKITRVQ